MTINMGKGCLEAIIIWPYGVEGVKVSSCPTIPYSAWDLVMSESCRAEN